MRQITLLLAFLFLTIGLSAQSSTGTLEGKITDNANKQPLMFANVSLYEADSIVPKTGTQTDLDGNYSISNIDSGKYDLKISYVGYGEKTIASITIYSGEINRLNVSLSEGVDIQEVVITYVEPLIRTDNTTQGMRINNGKTSSTYRNSNPGVVNATTKKSTIQADNIRQGTKISSEDIANSPSVAISGIVSTTAGVTSTDDGQGVNIRGSRSNAPIIYVDGVRYERGNIPQSEVEQVETVTGGIPAAYGNAMGEDAIKIVDSSSHNIQRSRPSVTSYPTTSIPIQEYYPKIVENPFALAQKNPLSTFSIDVDRAAYSNVRRFINNGQLPPKDAVRIEELVNYFDYELPKVTSNHPVNVQTEYADCPWNNAHKLLRVSLNSKKLDIEKIPPSNFVFLIDVSGSMSYSNKLPLLKEAFELLVKQLGEEDKISIVVYAGAAGLVLEPTSGIDKKKILKAINNLNAGGSTAGGAGINLAYKIAQEQFIEGGNNRIILATDGDFNVGISSDSDMETLIEEKRKSGIFLTCLGFGMGNYKDSKLETLADKGNGNYAYVDNIGEAKKLFGAEFNATMFAVAKDVKLQLEFNPENVAAYRLIGYENRLLNDEDFQNDAIWIHKSMISRKASAFLVTDACGLSKR